jgi:hypothetical protein
MVHPLLTLGFPAISNAILGAMRGWMRKRAERLRIFFEVCRDARQAETIHWQLSRLCETELTNRGMSRQQALALVKKSLTRTRRPRYRAEESSFRTMQPPS